MRKNKETEEIVGYILRGITSVWSFAAIAWCIIHIISWLNSHVNAYVGIAFTITLMGTVLGLFAANDNKKDKEKV